MEIKTSFWDQKNVEDFKQSMMSIVWVSIIFNLVNIAYYVMAGLFWLGLSNFFMFIFYVIIIMSYNKSQKKKLDAEVSKDEKGKEV